MKFLILALTSLCWITTVAASEFSDSFLLRVIEAYNLRPLPTKPFEETSKFKLGRAIFFDPIISGNRDVSCATCHLLHRGTSDGLAISSGTGAIGLAESRSLPADRPQQPRNAPGLWNLDNNTVTSMFWDGRIEMLDPVRRIFRNPLGHNLPKGFENLMAVQAIFPIAREDELLGRPQDRSPATLPYPHGNIPNEIASLTNSLSGLEEMNKISQLIIRRLIGSGDDPERQWHSKYRMLVKAAYPNVSPDDLSIVHIGNAVSHFEEIAFATRDAPWDSYLKGDTDAIGISAKRGALVFYGKGRCAVCHNGPLFSDFGFHAIGVQNNGPGIKGGEDFGRYHATKDLADKFKFRTPPLRNVTLTAPYFHNGSAETLEDVIAQHLDPLQYADKYKETGRFRMSVEQINAISPILLAVPIRILDRDVSDLKAFLKALEDKGLANIQKIVPLSVPSGLPVASVRPKVETE
jgi:cytochrome c peroxidase